MKMHEIERLGRATQSNFIFCREMDYSNGFLQKVYSWYLLHSKCFMASTMIISNLIAMDQPQTYKTLYVITARKKANREIPF